MGPSLPSVRPLGELLDVIESSLKVSQRHHFFLWTQGELQVWLPHEALICCLFGRDGVCSHVQQFSWKPYFKDDSLLRLCQSRHGLFARLLKAWREAGSALQFKIPDLLTEDSSHSSHFIAESIAAFSRASIHGVRGHDGNVISIFVFLGVHDIAMESRSKVMELIVPHMYAALVRVLHETDERSGALLPTLVSAREQEILKLISVGKTNPEIAQILYLSPFTIKNHIKNIFKKLNTTSRSQAVVLALTHGLIDSTR